MPRHVSSAGLTLECGRADAVQINGGSDNLVAGCTIRNVGNSRRRGRGRHKPRCRDCDIYETGDGGISSTGGDRKTLTPADHSPGTTTSTTSPAGPAATPPPSL